LEYTPSEEGDAMYPPLAPLFSRARDPEQVAAIALDHALGIAGRSLGNVQLANWEESGGLEIVAQHGFGDEFLSCFRVVRISNGCACGRALLSRDMVNIPDVLLEASFAPFQAVMDRAGVRSVQSFPLISLSGALLGMLSVHDAVAGTPSQVQLDALSDLAYSAANAIIAIRASWRSIH
jgi:GAF domain-containing protein